MSTLETSQIIFNLVISLAVVVVAVFVSIIALEVVKFIRSVKVLSSNINKESAEIYNKMNNFLEAIFSMAFVSKFFNKKKKNIK